MKIINSTDGKQLGRIIPNDLNIGEIIYFDNEYEFVINGKIDLKEKIILYNYNYIIEIRSE